MQLWIIYIIIAAILVAAELIYFRIAEHYNIIDKPNERSSHTGVVLRGGGIIFLVSLWVWSAFFGFQYPWLLVAVTLVAGVSFMDDVHSLPDRVRLVVQFLAMGLIFYQLDIMHLDLWWAVVLGLIMCVGGSNIYNFMDGINGITAGYSLAILIPLFLLNLSLGFIEESFLVVTIIGVLVFSVFNFRPKGMAKCFAGDVGSVGIAFILLFSIGKLVVQTWDLSYLFILWLIYGVDSLLTIAHRIMLHEHLGEAHRKHAYQIMVNELKIGHVKVSLLYMILQLTASLGFIYLCPDTVLAHWLYFFASLVVMVLAYVVFMKKYYHLHEEYLNGLNDKNYN